MPAVLIKPAAELMPDALPKYALSLVVGSVVSPSQLATADQFGFPLPAPPSRRFA